jgi:hypothetical protein
VDEHDALEHKQDRTRVRGVRKVKRKVLVQIRGHEENEAKPATSSNDVGDCRAATLIVSSLAAVLLGFWEGDACGREGIL